MKYGIFMDTTSGVVMIRQKNRRITMAEHNGLVTITLEICHKEAPGQMEEITRFHKVWVRGKKSFFQFKMTQQGMKDMCGEYVALLMKMDPNVSFELIDE